MDFADGVQNLTPLKWQLGALQLASSGIGVAASIFGGWAAWVGGGTLFLGLNLTGWGLILAVVSVALAMIIDKVKGDCSAQWLEHSYWGTLSVNKRYTNSIDERDDFNKLMAGA